MKKGGPEPTTSRLHMKTTLPVDASTNIVPALRIKNFRELANGKSHASTTLKTTVACLRRIFNIAKHGRVVGCGRIEEIARLRPHMGSQRNNK